MEKKTKAEQNFPVYKELNKTIQKKTRDYTRKQSNEEI